MTQLTVTQTRPTPPPKRDTMPPMPLPPEVELFLRICVKIAKRVANQ